MNPLVNVPELLQFVVLLPLRFMGLEIFLNVKMHKHKSELLLRYLCLANFGHHVSTYLVLSELLGTKEPPLSIFLSFSF